MKLQQFLFRYDTSFHQQLEPKHGLIEFLFHDAHFRGELRIGTCARSFAEIRSDTRAGAQHLSAYYLSGRTFRQSTEQPDHPKCKLLRPIAQPFHAHGNASFSFPLSAFRFQLSRHPCASRTATIAVRISSHVFGFFITALGNMQPSQQRCFTLRVT